MVDSKDQIPEGKESEYITKAEDYRLRTRAVNNNAKLVTDFFTKRVELFVKEVMEPYLGVREHIIRYVNKIWLFNFVFNVLFSFLATNSKAERPSMPIWCLLFVVDRVLQPENWHLKPRK